MLSFMANTFNGLRWDVRTADGTWLHTYRNADLDLAVAYARQVGGQLFDLWGSK